MSTNYDSWKLQNDRDDLGPDWADWLDAEEAERDEARSQGRMMDDDIQTDLEWLTERVNYLRSLPPPDIDDSVPF